MPNAHARLRSPACDTFVALALYLPFWAVVVTRPRLYRTVKTYVGKRDQRQISQEGSAAKYCVFCGKNIYHGMLCLTEARMFASLSKLSELHFCTLSSPPPALVIWVPPQIWHSLVAISVGCCCTRIMTDFDAVHRIYGCIKAGPVAMECPPYKASALYSLSTTILHGELSFCFRPKSILLTTSSAP